MKALIALTGCVLLLSGCGVAPSVQCVSSLAMNVSPAVATADHSAPAPGNQVQFKADVGAQSTNAARATSNVVALVFPAWTNPDPLDISISSAPDPTNGVATCNSSTSGYVTLTATYGSGSTALSKTVSLTCQ
jgi:hypothetical protein